MRTRTNYLTGPLLALLLAGCASPEYGRAQLGGEAPWYVVTISSPDAEIVAEEMKVYKLLRRADSEEGKSEGLKSDRQWGEGHARVERKSGTSITTSIRINWAKDLKKWSGTDLDICTFELTEANSGTQRLFQFKSAIAKTDACEKTEFENPYLSVRLQSEDRKWMTLDFQFRRGGS